jgi:hypothetical protein
MRDDVHRRDYTSLGDITAKLRMLCIQRDCAGPYRTDVLVANRRIFSLNPILASRQA